MPLLVILPVVAVTFKLPPTVEVAKFTAVGLARFASPPAPGVFILMLPVPDNWSRVISASVWEMVKVRFPPTVTVPLSVILPVVAVTFNPPPTLEAAKLTALELAIAASAPLPFVLTAIVPVLASLSKVISAPLAEVVKLLFPPTVTVPLLVILPVFAVTFKLPPT